MRDYLIFRLYGPMAAWGEIAVGESRHSAVYPGKSALIGLLAAALGICRDAEDRQAALAGGYRFAVKLLSAGTLLKDYHTAQVPDAVGRFIYRTRRDEIVIGRERLGTLLSGREYRCDALAYVAVCAEADAPYTLEALKQALERPKFVLYLGRKSCPLGAPLQPRIVSASGFRAALDRVERLPVYLHLDRQKRYYCDWDAVLLPLQAARFYWEGDGDDLVAQQTLTRHDQPGSRRRWQFTSRQEHVYQAREGE